MYFFTADEHYGHAAIIDHCQRPFSSVEEMDEALIQRHNQVVGDGDTVVHCGDFAWCKTLEEAEERYISRLNGRHIFLRGSHDRWLGKGAPTIHTVKIDKQLIVACHYAMRTWPSSHYGSWHVYGHSHCALPLEGLSIDVGVDCHDFMPVSFEQLRAHFGDMKTLEAYSKGLLGRKDAMRKMNVSYFELLDMLAEAGLELPSLPDKEINQMAQDMNRILDEAE
ncbi:MAG: hypothetical protein AB7E55_22420 [Pigmentiphaga sp.]